MVTHMDHITTIAKLNLRLQCQSQICVVKVMHAHLLQEP